MSTRRIVQLVLAGAFAVGALPGVSELHAASPRCRITAGTIVAQRSGNWSFPQTWGGAMPSARSRVAIPKGVRVTLDVNPPPLKSLFVEGGLRVAPRSTRLTAEAIMVHGVFQAGTASQPFRQRLEVTLTGTPRSEAHTCSGMMIGAKVLAVMNGGRLSLNAPSETSWTRLTRDVAAGDREIAVAEAVGWKPGDSVVIASRISLPGQAERRRVVQAEGNTVTLDRPLAFAHSGTAPRFDGRILEMRSEVGRLTRRIVIQGDPASESLRFGGHVMIMEGGRAEVDGVEFFRLGQFNRLGRYPFHWHLAGDASGQFLRNSAVHGSIQRGVVVHGTQNALVERNVVFDSPGHNFAIEDPSATGNTLRENLAIENRPVVFTDPVLADQRDNQVANFWIRAARNVIVGNAAAGSAASGFWYDRIGDAPATFRRNVAHSSYTTSVNTDFVRDAGLLVENLGEAELAFSDSVFYQNGNGIWPTEFGAMRFDRIAFADHWRGPPMTMDASGARTVFSDCLVVGRTRPPQPGDLPLEDDGSAPSPGLPPTFLLQYSGLAELLNPVFANYDSGGLLAANDIFVDWQAEFFVQGARFLNTPAAARNLHDLVITTLRDDSWGPPAGTYVAATRPQLAPASAERFPWREDEALRMPGLLGYAALRTRIPTAGGFDTFHAAGFAAVRSDGLRFTEPDIDGFRVICGGAYRYRLEQAPPTASFFVSLDNHGTPMPEDVAQTVLVSLPLAAPPSVVARIPDLHEDALPPAPQQRLTAAATLAGFEANPHGTYFYSPTDKLLHVQADPQWLVVQR